ncbi:MAG: T9SS type A sorting domain-containing protein [Bacteroidia bacterium]
MKKRLLFTYFLISTLVGFTQNTPWAKRIGDYDNDDAKSIVCDDSSNVIIYGEFYGTIDFDPGPGVFNMFSAGTGSATDLYYVKLNAAGNLVWAKKFGGTGYEFAHQLTNDKFGNIYLSGKFNGTLDFDPGPGVFNMTVDTINQLQFFILKLNPAGNFVWAKKFGGGGSNTNIFDLHVDDSLNVYFTGEFSKSYDYDPGPGVTWLNSRSTSSIFILKLNSLGNFVWAKATGGKVSWNSGYAIDVDAAGSVYVTGSFNDTSDFDTGPGVFNLISQGTYDIFALKLNNIGNFVWAKRIGGYQSDVGLGLALDEKANCYFTGQYIGNVDFNPNAGIFNMNTSSANYFDSYILKLDSSGGFAWAKRFGGTGDDNGNDIKLDKYGNIYSIGEFNGTADFNPSTTVTYNLVAASTATDVFISKLDSSGNFIWANKVGGGFSDFAHKIAIDTLNNAYVVGTFKGTADFDPGSNVFSLTSSSANYADIFILKLNSFGTMPVTLTSFEARLVNEKVQLNWATANEINNSHFEIERTNDPNTGTWKYIGKVNGNGNSNTLSHYQFVDSLNNYFLPQNGFLYYRLKQIDFDGSFVYSKTEVLNFNRRKSLNLYPNPVHDILSLSESGNISIYDLQGRLVLTQLNTAQVNISNLENGIYLAYVFADNIQEVVKIIKQ